MNSAAEARVKEKIDAINKGAAEAMARAKAIEVLVCPTCGGDLHHESAGIAAQIFYGVRDRLRRRCGGCSSVFYDSYWLDQVVDP